MLNWDAQMRRHSALLLFLLLVGLSSGSGSDEASTISGKKRIVLVWSTGHCGSSTIGSKNTYSDIDSIAFDFEGIFMHRERWMHISHQGKQAFVDTFLPKVRNDMRDESKRVYLDAGRQIVFFIY
jgi:hypothetical protein